MKNGETKTEVLVPKGRPIIARGFNRGKTNPILFEVP